MPYTIQSTQVKSRITRLISFHVLMIYSLMVHNHNILNGPPSYSTQRCVGQTLFGWNFSVHRRQSGSSRSNPNGVMQHVRSNLPCQTRRSRCTTRQCNKSYIQPTQYNYNNNPISPSQHNQNIRISSNSHPFTLLPTRPQIETIHGNFNIPRTIIFLK